MNYKIKFENDIVSFKDEKCFKSGIDYILQRQNKNTIFECEIFGKPYLYNTEQYIDYLNDIVAIKHYPKYSFQFTAKQSLEFLFKASLVRYCLVESFGSIVDNFVKIKQLYPEISTIKALAVSHTRKNRGKYVNLNHTIFPNSIYTKNGMVYTNPSHTKPFNEEEYIKYITNTFHYPSFSLYFNK